MEAYLSGEGEAAINPPPSFLSLGLLGVVLQSDSSRVAYKLHSAPT